MRILIVEDDAIIAMSAEQVLSNAGFHVIGPVASVEAALEAARLDRPDLALVDINLRGNDDGPDLARRLKHEFGLRSVFASGQPDTARANRDAALGILHKPYTDADLRDTIPVLSAMIDGKTPPPPKIPKGLETFSP